MIAALLLVAAAVAPALRPDPCTHGADEPRPRVTRADQARARRTIDAAVAEIDASADFRRLLLLVAQREASLQPGAVHRLPADVDAALAAWRRTRHLYVEAGNPHADDPDRWRGYGLFGMNSPYFLQVWDRAADPRVLCDAAIDVLVYRRAAARLLRRLSSATCRAGQPVTWGDLHRAVARGKLCGGASDDFRQRAVRVGLDPDAPVRAADLGREPAGSQGAAAARIRIKARSET